MTEIDLIGLGGGLLPAAQELHHGGHHRDEDNGHEHDGEVVLDEGQIAEEIPAEGKQRRPQQAAKDVEADEVAVGHASHTGYEGGKGADDGDEARQEDGDAAVLLVESVGTIQVFFLEEARVFGEDARADGVADPVIGRIPGHGGQRDHHVQHEDIQGAAAQGGQRAGGEEQRVARQEGRHHEAGLHEDDEEDQPVDPRAELGDQHGQVLIQVQEQIDNVLDELHDYPLMVSLGELDAIKNPPNPP